MKRIISMLLITLLVFTFCLFAASCKGDDQSKSDNSSVDDHVPGYAPYYDRELIDALSNTGDVTVYSFSEGELSEKEKDFTEYFNTIYGASLTYKQVAWEGRESTFINDFTANQAPDVVTLWYKLWPKAANRGLVCSVDRLAQKGVLALDHPVFEYDAQLCENNFTYKNSRYGISVCSTSAVYCAVNTDLFKAHGVKSPVDYYNEGNWTVDTLIQCCTELTCDTADVFGYYGRDLGWFVTANGGQLVEMDDEGKLCDRFDSANALGGFEYAIDLYTTKKVATTSDSWQAGRIGIYADLKQNIGNKLVEDKVAFNWDIVPFPTGKDNKDGLIPGEIDAYAVTATSKNPQGAVNYIIAKKVFDTIYNKEYPDSKMSKYSEAQLFMFNECDLMAQNALFMGVGTLWRTQNDFWHDLSHANGDVSEILSRYRSIFRTQCELETDNVNG